MKHTPEDVKKRKTKTLIVSDVHLGSGVSRSDRLIELLRETDFKRLILLGDIVNKIDQKRLNTEQWELLSEIRKLTAQKREKEVVWIQGNHDTETIETVPILIGTKTCKEYAWEENGKRFLAIHGDRFDNFIFNEKTTIGYLGHLFYVFLQKIDKNNKHIVRFLDSSYTSSLQLGEKVAEGAARYARDLKMNYVFCGHTHEAMEKVFFENENSQPVHYYNVGCWTRDPSTFATVDEDGIVKIEEFR